MTPALLLLAACSMEAWLFGPDLRFAEVPAPAAPDYALEASWAALPDRVDAADLVPPGLTDAQDGAPADVFYVHPTSLVSTTRWNDDLAPDGGSAELLREVVLPLGAAPFNGCCRVWAPRYRSASIAAWFGEPEDAHAAMSLAWGDVERAFDAFLARTGDRPFVLAAQSQGATHAMRLLERVDADPALRRRLVVAYLPGAATPRRMFTEAWPHLVPCDGREVTGCVAGWDTWRQGTPPNNLHILMYWVDGELTRMPDEPRLCTNPVSWTDGGAARREAHLGAVGLVHGGREPRFTDMLWSEGPWGYRTEGLRAPAPALVDALCEDGVLYVSDLDDTPYPASETGPGNYHLMDIELFAMDLREDARRRVAAWLAAQAP